MDVLTFFSIVIVAWLVAFLALYTRRKKLQEKGVIFYPFFVFVRKDARAEWFPKISKSRMYRVLDWVFMGLAYLSMGLGFWLVASIAMSKITSQRTTAALIPIVPGVTVPLEQTIYILVAIAVAVSLHELMHAMSSTSNGIKVKGGGILLLFIFPGAFVEPDEEEFRKASTSKRIKVVASGVAVNLILALVALSLLNYLGPALSQGALIVSVVKGYPAYNASIKPGEVIVAIDGHTVRSPNQVDPLLNTKSPNTVTLLVNGSLVNKTLTTPEGKLGVFLAFYYPSPIVSGFMTFLQWFYIINFSLATLNALPLFITDGTKLISELFQDEKRAKTVSLGLSAVTLMLLLMAIQF